MRRALVAGLLLALNAPLALAQSTDDLGALRKEIEGLKDGQAALLRELQQIKRLLGAAGPSGRPAAPSEVVLTVGDAPFKGRRDARLTLVEFTDYQ